MCEADGKGRDWDWDWKLNLGSLFPCWPLFCQYLVKENIKKKEIVLEKDSTAVNEQKILKKLTKKFDLKPFAYQYS